MQTKTISNVLIINDFIGQIKQAVAYKNQFNFLCIPFLGGFFPIQSHSNNKQLEVTLGKSDRGSWLFRELPPSDKMSEELYILSSQSLHPYEKDQGSIYRPMEEDPFFLNELYEAVGIYAFAVPRANLGDIVLVSKNNKVYKLDNMSVMKKEKVNE